MMTSLIDTLKTWFKLPTNGWDLYFQDPASPVMERVIDFHGMLMVIISIITAVVVALVLFTLWRFRAKRNPNPSKTTHNTLLEIIWTVIPCLILVIIIVPSMKMLYYMDRTNEPEMTLKVTGYQWYWGYEYPDHGDISFLSYMVSDEEIKEDDGQQRLLSVDNPVYLPVDTNIRILITAADVLHSFAVPAFGIKKDAVPGRINETWVNITKEGTYYGQCSELCGKNHAYMPTEIRAVSKEKFAQWVEQAKKDL